MSEQVSIRIEVTLASDPSTPTARTLSMRLDSGSRSVPEWTPGLESEADRIAVAILGPRVLVAQPGEGPYGRPETARRYMLPDSSEWKPVVPSSQTR